jgi:pyruvate dehydrogenase E1 component beta subunit
MAELRPESMKKVVFNRDREQVSYREAIREALVLEMRRDPNIILMGEDLAGRGIGYTDKREEMSPETVGVAGIPVADAWGGPMGVTKGLWWEFGPERVRDTPITEAAFIGAGVGAAASGIRPVVELMFIDFCGVAMDQIYNQAAKMRYMFGGKARIPLVIRTTIGSGVRSAAHHSQSIYSIFVHMPGLKVVAPSTPYDAKGLLTTALRQDDPVVFCEHKLLYSLRGRVPEESYSIPFGKADIKRDGKDVTVVAISRMVHFALEAADILGKEGTSVEVVDPRTLSPLDKDTIIGSVKETGRLVIVDEDYPRCNMATDIAAMAADEAFDYLDAPIKRVTPPHTPIPFSAPLEDSYTPNAGKIINAVREIVA